MSYVSTPYTIVVVGGREGWGGGGGREGGQNGGASWRRKFGYLCIQEILRPSIHVSGCEMSYLLA